MKCCSGCGETKAITEFYVVRSKRGSRDGLMQKCKPCSNAQALAWQRKNKDRMAQKSAEWRAANPELAREVNAASLRKRRAANLEACRERERLASAARPKDRVKRNNAAYYERNKDRIAQRNKDWAEKNPGSRAKRKATRRAAEFNATPAWANLFFIGEAYHLAKLREKATGFKWHVDHIVPLNSPLVCGLHVEHNLQVIPARTNLSKSNLAWPDMP